MRFIRGLKSISYLFVLFFVVLSCKTTQEISQSTEPDKDYLLRQIHMEPRNSSYDDLIAQYIESQKTWRQKQAEAFAKDTLVHIAKSPCPGRCPVFHFTVFNSGNVKFDGDKNTKLVGIYESKLEPSQKQKLQEILDQIEFVKLYGKYPPGINLLEGDIQTTNFVISDGEIKFRVLVNYDQPEILKKLELYLEQLIDEIAWVQI